MISHHIRPLFERAGGQVEGHEPERAEGDEQDDEQEHIAEAEHEAVADGAQPLSRRLTKYLLSEVCATPANRRARSAPGMP